MNNCIDSDIFKVPLDKTFADETKDRSKSGHHPFDKLVFFTALLIQSLYNLLDDQLKCQLTDRASFKRFLGLEKSDKVPDSKTKFIEKFEVTDASVQDSQPIEKLLTEKEEGQPFYADNAYDW